MRLYAYDFSEVTNLEKINLTGFKLQCAGRMFAIQSKIDPVSLAIVYPAVKAVVYLVYHPDEKIEDLIMSKNPWLRRYGEHCHVCVQPNCKPLLDRTDNYGWKISEINV